MLDIADFALQEQPEDNLLVSTSQAWGNGSYVIAAKPIKSMELDYTMIEFEIHVTAFSTKHVKASGQGYLTCSGPRSS